jgi:hypothetical protein
VAAVLGAVPLGGHGVVGMRLSQGLFSFGGLEFTAIGTAVRAPGAAYAQEPFTCDLSGQDFAKLIMAGWAPAGPALGISIGSRHDDRATAVIGTAIARFALAGRCHAKPPLAVMPMDPRRTGSAGRGSARR